MKDADPSRGWPLQLIGFFERPSSKLSIPISMLGVIFFSLDERSDIQGWAASVSAFALSCGRHVGYADCPLERVPQKASRRGILLEAEG